jgi:hypothetical protein
MRRRTRIGLVVGLLAAQAIAGPVSADQGRWTKGDAEAMLRTYPLTGQIFVRLDEALGLDIRPFPEFSKQPRIALRTGMSWRSHGSTGRSRS